MTTYRDGLPPRPPRMLKLPLNDKGYPVPWFVEWIDGKPEFRVMSAAKRVRAVKQRLCWLCGEPLGRFVTFVAGPMCGVNRTSAEPPCHHDCATYAAIACPFMTLPKAQRREANLPEGGRTEMGAIPRNPGVAMLWTCEDTGMAKGVQPFRTPDGGWLIRMGEPHKIEWYAEGRPATREEVEESVTSGLPLLQKVADDFGEGEELAAAVKRFQPLLPA